MIKTKIIVNILMSLLIFTVSNPTKCFAWSAVAHMAITKTAGFSELEAYSNLPDNWASKSISSGLFTGDGAVTFNFAWSHQMLTNAKWSAYDTPIIGNEDPSEDMIILIKKMRVRNQEMINTALGWAAHLAADNESTVHFQYFLSGSIDNWLSHKYLEEFCDILIYVKYSCGGVVSNAFDVKIEKTSNRVTSTGGKKLKNTEFTIPWRGNSNIMVLAQKVYRKNQQSSSVNKFTMIDITNVATINELMTAERNSAQTIILNVGFDEYVEARRKVGQRIICNNGLPKGTVKIKVEDASCYKKDDEICIAESPNNSITTEILAIDYLKNIITLKKATTKTFSADCYVVCSDLIMPPSPPYEPYFDRSVKAVKTRVTELKAKLND